ncbi:hypothetical protein [Geothrix sp. PMB-07]|uniref:hypothetical protein n=1 Tax=Geothrix sp. PMB-07 TaxID=3068640 RepID=UPI002741D776|nr:hypothetical protein [Geothrix sp. PMB-07]WLT33280.1 hypothetical protein Q9293_08070 [Geothrix sp. PMB-07]
MLVTCFYPTLAAALLYGSTLALAACESRSTPVPLPPTAPKTAGLEVKAIGSYIFLKGREDHSMFIVSSGAHMESTDGLKARFGTSFLWFLHDRKPYVIQDEATLLKAGDLFKGDASLEEQDHRLEAQEDQLETQRNGLDARREALDDKLERLDEQDEALDEESSATAGARARLDRDRQAIDRDMLALDKEQRVLDQAAEKLNAEREALSAKQEKLMEAAERQLLQLMLQAVKSGLAHPVADKMKAS